MEDARITAAVAVGLPTIEPDGITSLTNPATRFEVTGEDLPKNLVTANVDYVVPPRFFVNPKVGYGATNQFAREGYDTWSYLRGTNSGLGNEDIAETTLPA